MKSSGAIALCIFVAVIVVSVYFGVAVWNECRADGHSILYCWSLASR